MSNAVLKGNASGTGTVTLETPNTNTDRTISIPDATGTMVVNGANSAIVSGTAVASTSGTSIDFTGIPSWVKRITVMFNGVSTNGTSSILVQIGSGSITTSGYASQAALVNTGGGASGANSTAGFISHGIEASNTRNGLLLISFLSSNVYTCSGNLANIGSNSIVMTGGAVTLSGVLDRVRITTVNGTDTFDAGSINILYE